MLWPFQTDPFKPGAVVLLVSGPRKGRVGVILRKDYVTDMSRMPLTEAVPVFIDGDKFWAWKYELEVVKP